MIKKMCRWVLSSEILDIEMKWWRAGVNQQLFEPQTAAHGHMSYYEYWGEEE